MADYRGRGRGGERGRGGGGGGERGRGGGGGSRGRGRGRGDFDGAGQGRGRGSATFSGYQGHDRGGRGAGRGAGRGRPDKFAGEGAVFISSNTAPRIDPAVTKLEDQLIIGQGASTLATQLAKTTLSDTSKPGSISLPHRPAFGNGGQKVTLWANYFKLNASAKEPLLKYSLTAARVDKKPKPEQKGKGSASQAGKDEGPKGKKLHSIIKSALDTVASSSIYATEFKSQVITLKPLSLPEDKTVDVHYRDEGKDDLYKVTFAGPVSVDLPALLKYLTTMHDPTGDESFPKFEDVLDAISIITGYHARSHSATSALGRSRYFALDKDMEFKDTKFPEYSRILRGYFQSARPATGRLILNVNVSTGVFRPTGLVSDLWNRISQDSRDQDRGKRESLNRIVSRLRARCMIPSEEKNKPPRFMQKTICGLADSRDGSGQGGLGNEQPQVTQFGAPAGKVKFYLRAPAPPGLKANAFCSVADYYKNKYGRHVDTNCPVVNVGTKKKPIYMPADLVEIIDGQPLQRKTNPGETRDMILFACRSPFANATSVSEAGRKVLGLDGSQILHDFGIQVDKTLLAVQGRELPPPTIQYSGQKLIPVKEGEWNMENVKVLKPGWKIERWFWFSVEASGGYQVDHSQVLGAMQQWINFLRQNQGLQISDIPIQCGVDTRVTVQYNQPAEGPIRAAFSKLKAYKPQLIFVVLPGRKTDTAIYNAVKKIGDQEFGILTQNVLRDNLMRRSPQLYANLGLKVNLKTGGVNHKLKVDIPMIRDHNTMVVGYDVTHHPNLGKNSEHIPSIVGMVASIDPELGQWPATVWAQQPRQEMLSDVLRARFTERLRLYQKFNRRLPANIIIFRDGVSEGQFMQVLQKELPHMREACQQLYGTNKPPNISLIVSVKRHQTRFYPTNPGNMVQSRNIKNGTVVDRGVTLAHTWDFFLTAHKGLQGTSRPAHYTVLLDEVFRNVSRDQAVNQLEKLTYEMCHLFGRATKAVSICPPAYYADILCTRARVYMSDAVDQLDNRSNLSGDVGSRETQNLINQVHVHPDIKDSMFYI
ncbi:ribonuclease H-like domain-containing protein [Nemania sp. FL0916]|nr:ribonuclease H-like domain-containing protein [Nemania sp. FL0916]